MPTTSSPQDSRSARREPRAGRAPRAGVRIHRGAGTRLFYRFCRTLVDIAARLYFRLSVRGVERVPATGPVILAANHQSFFDPPFVGARIRRPCFFLARESLFRVPVLCGLIRRLGALPVPRESVAPKQALATCLEILAAGEPLVLFPEGTRTRTGRMGPFRRGIALLARRSRAPVVPVWIDGAYRAWPRHRRFPRPGRVRILYGEPLVYDEKNEDVGGFLGRLRSAIEDLSRQAGPAAVGGRGGSPPPHDSQACGPDLEARAEGFNVPEPPAGGLKGL